MFNNLIESSSHTVELKRRGSFMLFTAVTYILLFSIVGVASIYAYDAQIEDPNAEIVVMLPPIEFVTPKPPAPVRNTLPPRGAGGSQGIPERRDPTASVNTPQVVPETTSATPTTAPPVPDSGVWRRSGRDFNTGGFPGAPGPDNGGGGDERSGTGTVPIEADPPAPEIAPKLAPRVVSKGVITSQAISLPKPAYPQIARDARVQGVVSIQVLIDESGKVVSAKAISGNPLLAGVSQRAAYGARFSPTRLGDQAVKVSGIITYNFTLQ